MSTGDDLLKALGEVDADTASAVRTIAQVYDALASFVNPVKAVYGTINSVLSFFGSLQQKDDEVLRTLKAIAEKIDSGFKNIEGILKAEGTLKRIRDIDEKASTIAAVFTGIDPYLRGAKVADGYGTAEIDRCRTALGAGGAHGLSHPSLWEVPYYQGRYYTNPWTDGLAPKPPEGEGTVPSSRYILAAYLQCLYQTIAAMRVYAGPNFATLYGAEIRAWRRRLGEVLAAERSAIKLLRKPRHDEIWETVEAGGVDGEPSVTQYRSWEGTLDGTPWAVAGGFWRAVGDEQLSPLGARDNNALFQQYGAVHVYLAQHNVEKYPALAVPDEGPPPGEVYLRRFDARYDLRAEWKRKQLFRAVGLSALTSALRNLAVVLGETNREPTDEGDWSVREIARVAGVAPRDGGTLRARDIAHHLGMVGPVTIRGMYRP